MSDSESNLRPTDALEDGEEFWVAANWYRGLPLSERRGREAGAKAVRERGREGDGRLRAWRAQKPFDEDGFFAARLDEDGLSEEDLHGLLVESADTLRARVGAALGWLLGLREAFAAGQQDAGRERINRLLEGVESQHPLAHCLPALGPLLERSLTSLIHAADARGAQSRFDPGVLAAAFVAELAPTLLFQLSKPLVLEMHIARLQGRLCGETAEARFEDFARQLSDGGLSALLRKYPVLARQLVLTVHQCRDYLLEVVTHLNADWEPICNTFARHHDPGLVAEIYAGKGDRHRNGRSVVVLRFQSGLRLVHKPKALAVDVHFQELLGWLNDRGAHPPLRQLKLLDRGDYGWSEFVSPAACRSHEEVSRFYQRQGAYLALLYALDATDLHNENLIADGEHPVLVDLEALFHPHVYGQDPILATNLAAGALDESVWQVGILPRRIWADEGSVGVDTSGLGGQSGQMNPHPIVGFDAPGSDEMRLGRRRVELPVSENRPRLGEHDVDVLEHKEAIIAGFTQMYRLLCRHRKALLSELLPRFEQEEIRVVLRSTNVYGLLLYESFHPDLLRDALDRDRFFDRLWSEVAQRPYLARVIAAERRDLWRGDIPMFTGAPGSRTVHTSDGEPIGDILDEPSMELVRQRIERLGEDDLAKQRWIIEASLATLSMDREPAIVRPRQSPAVVRPVSREDLLDMADKVGERLGELALQSDAGAYWLGVVPLDEFTWGLVPSGMDLYAGTAGLAMFLAYLGERTGKRSHARLAERAVRALSAQIQPWTESGEDVPFHPIGAFEGLASVIYALTHLGVLWGAAELLDNAERLAGALPSLIARDEQLDVIYGSAGCILVLLALHAIRPSSATLEVAVSCGDRLLATRRSMEHGIAWTTLADQPPLAGLSHGAAGCALSLLRLGARSGCERFSQAALAALEYERSLFIPALNNWADLRVFPGREQAGEGPGEPRTKSMVAWCHGAPGIGLARLAALDCLDDAEVRREIDVAVGATIDYGFNINHSLCHGGLGNIELLLMAAERLNRPQDRQALEQAAAYVVASIESNGWMTGVPLAVETPGLMTGLAGIGYELLRLAEPGKVPSILVLAPPPGQPPS